MSTNTRFPNAIITAAAAMVALFITPSVAREDRAAGEDNIAPSSVWKVQTEGGRATLYLAGSIHLLREEDHPLPTVFDQAFAASEELILEVAAAEMQAAQDESMRLGMYGDKGKISDDLSPAAYGALRQYLEAAGLPRTAMDGFRPWMASMMISMTEMMKLGGLPELGADSFFEDKAIRQGKPVRGLETSKFQIGLFAGLDREDQEAMLAATLRDMKNIETEFPRMVEAWRTGDDAALDEIMHESLDGLPELRRAILDKRNADWVGKFDKILAGERSVMAVVGAGHLVGEEGVVALLKRRGHRVERVGAPADPEGAQPPSKAPGRFIEL